MQSHVNYITTHKCGQRKFAKKKGCHLVTVIDSVDVHHGLIIISIK